MKVHQNFVIFQLKKLGLKSKTAKQRHEGTLTPSLRRKSVQKYLTTSAKAKIASSF